MENVLAPQTYGPGSTWGAEFDPLDTEQRFLYVPDGTNNKVWALDRATLEPVYSWGTAENNRAISIGSTTWISIRRGISTPARCRPGTGSRSSCA